MSLFVASGIGHSSSVFLRLQVDEGEATFLFFQHGAIRTAVLRIIKSPQTPGFAPWTEGLLGK